MRDFKLAILGGLIGALVVGLFPEVKPLVTSTFSSVVKNIGPQSAQAAPVHAYIKQYATAQAFSPGGCVASASCTAASFTTTGTSSASQYTATSTTLPNFTASAAADQEALVIKRDARIYFDWDNTTSSNYLRYNSSVNSLNWVGSNFSVGNSNIIGGSLIRNADAVGVSVQSSATDSSGTAAVILRVANLGTNTTAVGYGFFNGSVWTNQVLRKSGAYQMLGDTNANKPACNSDTPGTAGATRGMLFFESDTSDLFFCDGSTWINLTP